MDDSCAEAPVTDLSVRLPPPARPRREDADRAAGKVPGKDSDKAPDKDSSTDSGEGPTPQVGVGPMPEPWPTDPRYDRELLRAGDRRNVIDRYRYWSVEAIVAELDTHRSPLHIAIQNWQHDFNIGSVVRTANAFNVSGVHILGRRRWNRRGAMVTDRYLDVHHHETADQFFDWLDGHGVTPVGVDNLPGSVPLEEAELPRDCCLVLGSEGPGLTDEVVAGLPVPGGDHPVRIDPLHQRRGGLGDRDVPLVPPVGTAPPTPPLSPCAGRPPLGSAP